VNHLQLFHRRRKEFLTQLGDKAAIIPAAPLVTHHADCEYPFRQNSDFWYLTGFDEPDAVALFLPFRTLGEQYILFVQDKEPGAEVWSGFRWGTEGAIEEFGVDIAHPLEDLPNVLGDYLIGAEGIAFRIGKHSKVEPLVLKTWSAQLDRVQRTGSLALSMFSPCPILHKMRQKKDFFEIERLREAARISAEAHELARARTSPGMNERQLQGVIEEYFLNQGARGPAYNSIVAGGDNACILHYTANNAPLVDGDLLLIDAGCSLSDYYNGDITRTFPVNGKFTAEQRTLYEVVLAAQEAAIGLVVSGKNAEEIHLKALCILIEGLIDIGLLVGNPESLIEQGSYNHLYMHRTGHWLGLDVHDVGAYRLGEYPVQLESGMVLTVEPGLYISDRLPIPKGQPEIHSRWKGIGIRIEDNVLVTDNNPDILTSAAKKSVKDMED
tara:strand:- start:1731 stop:3050 length:1320 start_codon:yes stop_codon:yes gene_type:complete